MGKISQIEIVTAQQSVTGNIGRKDVGVCHL